jgi:hypothetical protein
MKIPAKVRNLAIRHLITVNRDHHGVYTLTDLAGSTAAVHLYAQSATGAMAKIQQLVRARPENRRKNPRSALAVRQEVLGAARFAAKRKSLEVPPTLSTRALDWINRHTGDFRRLVASMRAHGNPAKLERCVQKVKKTGKARNAYAVCTAALKKSRRANPSWYIHVQRMGKGPVMLWNGKSFNDRPEARPVPFHSPQAAMQKARWLLGKYHEKLSAYKIWVSDQFFGASQEARRVNPESLDAAAQKLEDFTGRPATHVERVRPRSVEKTGWVLGEMDLIGYRAARKGIEGGKKVRYSHKFRVKDSRPLLATSTDGKQLHVVGGRYEVTEAGIEDR